MNLNRYKSFKFYCQNKILTSKSEARRAIANKGLKINDTVC